MLGRSRTCQLRLPGDTTVSRQHCLIELENDGIWVQDLGSLNGTFVNGQKIGQREHQPGADATMVAPARQELQDGDELRICNNVFAVVLVEAPAPVEAPPVLTPKPRVGSSEGWDEPAAKPTVLRRYTDVFFPPKVRVGKPTNLRVRIARTRLHAHDATLDLEWPTGVGAVPVTVCVAAENFTVESDPHATLFVPREDDSPAVQFRLIGNAVGPGRIMLDFSQHGRPVGSVDLSVAVLDSPIEVGPASAPQSELRLRVGGDCPDVTLTVHEYRCSPGRLHFTLYSRDPRLRDLPWINHGDLGSIDLHQDTVSWVGRHLDFVNCWPSAEQGRSLADFGNRLYDQVLPEKLQQLCWTLAERRVTTLLVLSDEPHIPWELIRPHRLDPASGQRQELPFWGEFFALGRWLRGPAVADRFSLRRICAVVPGASSDTSPSGSARNLALDSSSTLQPEQAVQAPALPGAQRELQVLLALVASGADVEVLPARRREVLATLENGTFDLLHVASHGAFAGTQAADDASLLLEDGAFKASELPPRLADRLRSSAPLIFFNACQTGRMGYSLTRLGAWSAELIRLGCGGFIGTHWRVTDDVALEVAREFYRLLLLRTPIAEALRRARLKVRESFPDDPTWLAYSCFADPNARLADCSGWFQPVLCI
jgi:hypothetical protein